MLEFTENDALDRVTEIGQAFANDLNDGDGPDYEELYAFDDMLIYTATLEDGTKVKFNWSLRLISNTKQARRDED